MPSAEAALSGPLCNPDKVGCLTHPKARLYIYRAQRILSDFLDMPTVPLRIPLAEVVFLPLINPTSLSCLNTCPYAILSMIGRDGVTHPSAPCHLIQVARPGCTDTIQAGSPPYHTLHTLPVTTHRLASHRTVHMLHSAYRRQAMH